MNLISRTITGIAAIVIGCVITAVGFSDFPASWPGLVWGVVIVTIGVYIFFNREEDKIEGIKEDKSIKDKK